MSDSTNIDKLTAAGIIPADYQGLSDAETATVNGLSGAEVDAIISAGSKMGADFLAKHAPHGMAY